MAIYVSETAEIVGDAAIASGSSIWHGAIVRADLDRIVIGKYSNVQDNAVIHLDKDFPTIVGDRVTVGHLAILHGCKVGSDCVIGMGSLIGNDAVIGDWSIVAPGAVVSESSRFPESSVIAGLPAEVIRWVDERLRHRINISWKIYYELAKKSLPARKELSGDRRRRTKIETAKEISRVIRTRQ